MTVWEKSWQKFKKSLPLLRETHSESEEIRNEDFQKFFLANTKHLYNHVLAVVEVAQAFY